MASVASLRTSVKARLDLSSVTTFDSIIDTFINDSVKRLYPYASVEVDAQTKSISPSMGEVIVDLTSLSTTVVGFRDLEYTTDGNSWHPVEEKSAHGKYLTVRGLPSDAIQLKVFGLNPYTITDLPEYLELGLVYYACAEFFNCLVGNKSKYNAYMNAAGSRSVDNMQDMAEYYESKADKYIADRATVYGY
jgi:hypothetical protein